MLQRDTIQCSWTKTLDDSFGEADDGRPTSQDSQVQMNCTYAICKQMAEFGNKSGILIHLCPSVAGAQATTVSGSKSGMMMLDTTWSKYWFITAIKVKIYPDDASQAAGVKIGYDAPPTTENNHQIDSSISVNAGFFGGTPTGGVAASCSFSTTIGDFKVDNNSDFGKGVLEHNYSMAATKQGPFDPKGGGINWWSGLLGGWGFLIHADSGGGLFGGIMGTPNDPPDAAVSNLPIASQGLWVVPDEFSGQTTFTVEFEILYLAAHTNALGPYIHSDKADFSQTFVIDWSQI